MLKGLDLYLILCVDYYKRFSDYSYDTIAQNTKSSSEQNLRFKTESAKIAAPDRV